MVTWKALSLFSLAGFAFANSSNSLYALLSEKSIDLEKEIFKAVYNGVQCGEVRRFFCKKHMTGVSPPVP